MLLGDALRLRQVLINLIGNALKFTERGKVHLEVVAHSAKSNDQTQAGSAKRYTFSVRDTGIGIPQENLDHLFDSFYQVDSSASRKYGGTGLGLAISKRIIEAMGGDITVSSKPGEGSLFEFTVMLETAPCSRKLDSECKEPGCQEVDFSHLNVLVAEDNPVNRQVVTFLLQQLGIEPILATNGLEACELSHDYPVDVILMDLQMPELDGLQATKKILTEHDHPPMIIAMTANALAEDRMRCKSAGMVDFLPKPMLLEDLKSVLEAASNKLV